MKYELAKAKPAYESDPEYESDPSEWFLWIRHVPSWFDKLLGRDEKVIKYYGDLMKWRDTLTWKECNTRMAWRLCEFQADAEWAREHSE